MMMHTNTSPVSAGVLKRVAATLACAAVVVSLAGAAVSAGGGALFGSLMSSVQTSFNPRAALPKVDPSAHVSPHASLIGAVSVGRRVMVAPHSSIRGDEGTPIHIGDFSNVQDGAVVHGLETSHAGEPIEAHQFEVGGHRYSVYVDVRVTLDHQSCVHGPALIGHDTIVGMQALVFNARVGAQCVIEPGAKVFGRYGALTIADGRYVKAGQIVTTQQEADALPTVGEFYPYTGMNRLCVETNVELADGYRMAAQAER